LKRLSIRKALIMTTNAFSAIRNTKPDAIKIIDSLDDINIRDDDGTTLLHSAIAYKNFPIGLKLIKRGIDVNAKTKKGDTPLHYCGTYQDLELTRAILEAGGDLSAVDAHGRTTLWIAVQNPKRTYEFLKLLAEFGCAEFASQENNFGLSPLEMAKDMGDEEAARIITSS